MTPLVQVLVGMAPVLCGCLLALVILRSLLNNPGSWLICAGLGVPVGSLLLLLVHLLFTSLDIPVTPWRMTGGVVVISVIVGCVLWLLGRVNRQPQVSHQDATTASTWGAAGAVLLLAVAVGFVTAAEAVSRPPFAWDAWQSWYPKAYRLYQNDEPVTFVNPQEWLTITDTTDVYYSNRPNHGLMLPVALAWIAHVRGTWDERWVGILAPLYGISGILILGGSLFLWGMAPHRCLLTAMVLAFTPFYLVHMALPGYADLPVGCFLAAICLLTPVLFRHPMIGVMTAGALLLGLYNVKESTIVWILLLAGATVLSIGLRRWPLLLRVAFLGMPFCLVLGTLMDFSFIVSPFGLVRKGVTIAYNSNLSEILSVMFLRLDWGIAWWLCAAAALLVLLRRPGVLQGQLLLVAGVLAFSAVGILMFTSKGAPDELWQNMNRILLNVYPVVLGLVMLAAEPGLGSRLWPSPEPITRQRSSHVLGSDSV